MPLVPVATDDGKALRDAMDGCEGLCHVAGAAGRFYAERDHYERSNVTLTETVFRAARDVGVRRAVYTGTVAILCELDNAYAQTKARGAQVAAEVGGSAMDVVVVHPSGMIGPCDRKPTPLGRAIALFAAGGSRVVVGGGSGYIHVDDAAAAHVAGLIDGKPGHDYVLDAEYWTTAALFEALATKVGHAPPRVLPLSIAGPLARVVEPMWRAMGRLPPINTFTTRYLALPRDRHQGGDASRQALGLPAYRTIDAALGDALRWFAEHGFDRAMLRDR